MAVLEIAEFFFDAFTVVGKLIFFSLMGVAWLFWEVLKIASIFVVAGSSYLHAFLYYLGNLFLDGTGILLPHVWNFASYMIWAAHWAFEYAVVGVAEFSTMCWMNPAFQNLRENFVTGIQNGAHSTLDMVLEEPLIAARVVLGGLWIILALVWRKDLCSLFRRCWIASVGTLTSSKDFIVFKVNEAVFWLWTPFRLVMALPKKARAALGSFLTYATRRCSQSLSPTRPAPNPKAAPTTDSANTGALFRGPSLFSRFKKTESVVQLEHLKETVRNLSTKLEEERESKLCIICQSNFRAVVVLPCKHFATCEECMALLPINILSRKVCPVCRTQISSTIKVYL